MSAIHIVSVLVGIALIVAGVFVYRRGGTQGGVMLMFVGLLALVHGFNLLDYRPSQAELEQL